MIEIVVDHIIPAAYAVLPPIMNSPNATAMVLACGLQETKFRDRRQIGGGPGRGFWQFERGGGVKGIVTHPDTRDYLRAALVALRYEKAIGQTLMIYQALEHNDVLAAVMARLNLWWLPSALPKRDDVDGSWSQYIKAWNPGAPHRSTWDNHYALAHSIVDPPAVVNPNLRRADE